MPDDTGGFVRIGPPADDTGGFKRAQEAKGTKTGTDSPSKLGALWRSFAGAAGGVVSRDVQMAKQLPGAIAQLPQVAQQQAQQNAGQSLAQRARNPQDMQTAMMMGTMAQPNMAPKVAMHAPPPSAAQSLAQDFKLAGVPPSIPAVGQGRAAGLTSQVGRTLPFSPVAAGMRRGFDATQQAAGKAAAGLGTPQNAEGAGSIVQNAVRRVGADNSQANRDYAAFDQAMAGAPPAQVGNAQKTLQNIMGRFPSAPKLSGMFTSPVIQKMSQELGSTAALSVPEIQELRTQIGYQLQHPTYGQDQIPRAQLKQLYGALSRDLQAAARKQGPEAVKALNRATINYGTRMKVLDKLEPLIKGDKSAEATFSQLNNAARSSGGANAGLLRTLKANATPQEWGDIGATMVSRLGAPEAGAKDLASAAEPFSVSSFVTNWNKLSDAAKDLFFGDLQMGSPRVGLERLARVASAQKNVSRLENVSHSGEYIGAARTVEAVLTAVAGGHLPLPTLGAVGGAYGLSKLLMSPGFARWLYRLPKDIAGAPSEDVAIQRGAAALQQQIMNPDPTHTPGQPPTRQPEPRVSDRIGAARKVGELSTQVYEAKRRGDLGEAQKLMRKLASAQADYRSSSPSS